MQAAVTEESIARQPPEAQAIIRLLLAEIVKLEVRIQELEGGRKTPQNSSLPPSSVHPHAKPASSKRKSKKKRGGQPGHEKHERPLIPTEDCDDVQPLKPTQCRRCGEKLSGSDPEPLRHQVWELPEIKPHVTEYQRHRLGCPACGVETTCAELPCGVPQGQSGPRLMAFTALLMAYYRQSKRRTAEFLSTLLGQPCCPALTVKIEVRLGGGETKSLVSSPSLGSPGKWTVKRVVWGIKQLAREYAASLGDSEMLRWIERAMASEEETVAKRRATTMARVGAGAA